MTDFYTLTRQKLQVVVSGFHTSAYPALTEINWPKDWRTDTEKFTTGFFVGVEFEYSPRGLSIPARQCVTMSGMLALTQYAREGQGEKIFTDYTGALHNYLGLKTVNGITFYEVKPYNNSGRPGFDGVMNAVNFNIDFFNV